APSRELAIQRMHRALGELRVTGVETSTPFHLAVMQEPEFRAGHIDILYLDRHGEALTPVDPSDEDLRIAALTAALLEHRRRERRGISRIGGGGSRPSAWSGRQGWTGR